MSKKGSEPLSLVSAEKQFILIPGGKDITINGVIYSKVEARSIHNAMMVAQSHSSLEGMMIYDIFADNIIIRKCPPWESAQTFTPHTLRDTDILYFRGWLEQCGIRISKVDAQDILIAIAQQNTVNPPKDYFEKLIWDKIPRLHTWLTYYLGVERPDDPNFFSYTKAVGAKWLIASVKRIYEPGCQFRNVLILEGTQNIGKSKAFSTLATIGGERYFIDGFVQFNNKDSLMQLQGKLIFEMAELASFKRAESEDVKAFLTRQIDEYRPPYGRIVVSRPRMFIIGGSVNPSGGYFKDPTGNERYWPVKCGNIDIEALERDREQLWAEAVYRYKLNEQIWLTSEENAIALIEQEERFNEDILAEDLAKAVKMVCTKNTAKGDTSFSLNDIVKELGITDNDKKTHTFTNRVKDWLTANYYIEARVRMPDGSRPRRWVKAVKI